MGFSLILNMQFPHPALTLTQLPLGRMLAGCLSTCSLSGWGQRIGFDSKDAVVTWLGQVQTPMVKSQLLPVLGGQGGKDGPGLAQDGLRNAEEYGTFPCLRGSTQGPFSPSSAPLSIEILITHVIEPLRRTAWQHAIQITEYIPTINYTMLPCTVGHFCSFPHSHHLSPDSTPFYTLETIYSS